LETIEDRVVGHIATRLLLRLPDLPVVGVKMRGILIEAIAQFDKPDFNPDLVSLFFVSRGVKRRTDNLLIRLLNIKHGIVKQKSPLLGYKAAVDISSFFMCDNDPREADLRKRIDHVVLGLSDQSDLNELLNIIDNL
jgi:hypothetical protein